MPINELEHNVIYPKDVTVGSTAVAILDKYVKFCEENGLPVHTIVVNDALVY